MRNNCFDVNTCFIDDSPGYMNGFWLGRNGLGLGGSDPDSRSKKLRDFHQLLWNKKLPNGQMMYLEKGTMSNYLIWNGMRFGSDSIVTQHRYKKCEKVIREVENIVPNYKEYVIQVLRETYTIGGMIIFPKIRNSMNQLRGTNPMIRDRWDLTLECIKRYYEQPDNTESNYNPLWNAINNSKNFFELFVDFQKYIEFFLLQDYLDSNGSVTLFFPHKSFCDDPLPKTAEEYIQNIEMQRNIVKKRNKRIQQYLESDMINYGAYKQSDEPD